MIPKAAWIIYSYIEAVKKEGKVYVRDISSACLKNCPCLKLGKGEKGKLKEGDVIIFG